MEWKEVDICQLCDSVSETYKGNASEVVLINTSDVLDGKCLNHEYVPNKKLKGQFKKTFRKGDILYSEIRPANKRFCFVDFEPKDYIASTKLMVLRAHEDVDPQYLYQILRSNDTLTQLQMLAESRSGTFPQITYSELSNIMVSLPSQKAQKNIVSILSSLDRKIELNNKINADLEEMAQAIFKNWFVDFEPFKDGKFVDSELGMIPEGWKVGGLFDIAEIFDKKRKPLSGNVREKMDKIYPYYGATSCMDYVDDYIFDGIYTLIGEDGSVVKENGLPYMQYVWGKMWVNNHAHILQGKNGYSTEMIHALLSIINIKFLVTGAVQAKLSQGNMQKILVAIPPKNVLDEIRPVIDNLYSKIRINTDENSRLSLLRDTLLPRLISGELEVPE
jgi:type I restriction enzyme S subunit